MKTWLITGGISVAVALFLYVWIFVYWRQSFFGMSLWNKITYLVSHVPDDRSPAWPHITAGVLFCGGLCLIAGAGVACLPFVEQKFDQHGTALTAGGLVFGVMISVISFWTLWQTKRIEQLQGANITGFKNLVASIAKEIERVNQDFLDHGNRASVNHRVLLATTNPYFGVLSFPDSPLERRFADAISNAAKNVRASNGGSRKFQLEILCGDSALVNVFNTEYFKNAEPNFNEVERKNALAKANEQTERFIADLERDANEKIIKRQRVIPMLQFAVIGNVVFEFIILEPRSGSITGIAGARKIEDRLVCDRFCSQLLLLSKLA